MWSHIVDWLHNTVALGLCDKKRINSQSLCCLLNHTGTLSIFIQWVTKLQVEQTAVISMILTLKLFEIDTEPSNFKVSLTILQKNCDSRNKLHTGESLTLANHNLCLKHFSYKLSDRIFKVAFWILYKCLIGL